MVMLPEHDVYFDEIFALADGAGSGFFADPVRIVGVQEILVPRQRWPQLTWALDGSRNATMRDLFLSKDLEDVREIDARDPRAELRWDLDEPIPDGWHESAHTLIDIGMFGHFARPGRVLENYLRMTKPHGLIVMQTPVKGFYGHGLYLPSSEVLLETFRRNGCDIAYVRYTVDGEMRGPGVVCGPCNECFPEADNVLMWLAARRPGDPMVDYHTPRMQSWTMPN